METLVFRNHSEVSVCFCLVFAVLLTSAAGGIRGNHKPHTGYTYSFHLQMDTLHSAWGTLDVLFPFAITVSLWHYHLGLCCTNLAKPLPG